ncbi:DUF4085 family protein [Clostridium sp. Marseille-P299]|uniref:DUF4085 family protein n=1 Tax=Clostridium sp. Marseille-P299 TaxID=1805477 RepID=UPI00082DF790|nr:DUF4085 family protein [Clostridium sp. Marseille-P299]
MKYLTKEWYKLCQRTCLHFGMKVIKGASVYNEELYNRLYKRKENEFVRVQHNFYDFDPRIMLEDDGKVFKPLMILSNSEMFEEDEIVYHMPIEERERIQKLIEEYDVRPPFDEVKCREEFRDIQETFKIIQVKEKLPMELIDQIADIRLFALGYCTRKVLNQLEGISNENEMKVNSISKECMNAQQAEKIPQSIKEAFGFHDCRVTDFIVDKDIVMRLNTQGGFTNLNKITFVSSEIIKDDKFIVGSVWIYHELYCMENGYEAHILLERNELSELIIRCKDIVIVKEDMRKETQ